MKNARLVVIAIILMCLTGCATDIGNQFDCPMREGIHCKRVDEINSMVDRGEITAHGVKGTTVTNITGYCGKRLAVPVEPVIPDFTPYPIAAIHPGDPLRYGETVMRIWVAPYEDKSGNYYQPSFIYHVVKPGFWIGGPPKATSNDGED